MLQLEQEAPLQNAVPPTNLSPPQHLNLLLSPSPISPPQHLDPLLNPAIFPEDHNHLE